MLSTPTNRARPTNSVSAGIRDRILALNPLRQCARRVGCASSDCEAFRTFRMTIVVTPPVVGANEILRLAPFETDLTQSRNLSYKRAWI